MGRWFWKIAEVLAIAIFGVFMLVPTYIEKDFLKALCAEQPALFFVLFGTAGLLIVATIVHRVVREGRDKKAENTETKSGII